MFSLVYAPEIQEFYICKSKNVIQEEEGVIVAFKAKLVQTHESKHELHQYAKYLLLNITSSKDFSETYVIDNKESLNFPVDDKSQIDIQDHELNEVDMNLSLNSKTDEILNRSEQCQNIVNSTYSPGRHLKNSITNHEHKENNIEVESLQANAERGPVDNIMQDSRNCDVKDIQKFAEEEISLSNRAIGPKMLQGMITSSQQCENVTSTNITLQQNSTMDQDQENTFNAENLEPNAIGLVDNIKQDPRNSEEICPKMLVEEMAEIVESDEVIKLYGLLEKQNYGDAQHSRIVVDMQILARVLLEIRKKDSSIQHFSEIFTPRHINNLKLVCSQEPLKGIKYDDLFYKCGKIFYNLVSLETTDFDLRQRKDIQEFIELLTKNPINQIHEKRTVHKPIKVEKIKVETEEIKPLDTTVPRILENRGRKRNSLNDMYSQELAIDLMMQEHRIGTRNQNTNLRSTCIRKRSSCSFCGKRYLNILAHVKSQHKDEEIVKELNSIPKGSPKKRKLIANLIRNASISDGSPTQNDPGSTDATSLNKSKNNLKLWNMLQDHVNCTPTE